MLHGSGSPALRRARLSRLCAEAVRQGAELNREDLSLLLGVKVSTIRRQARLCAAEGVRPQAPRGPPDIHDTHSLGVARRVAAMVAPLVAEAWRSRPRAMWLT